MRCGACSELDRTAVTHCDDLRLVNPTVFLSVDPLHNIFSCNSPLKFITSLNYALHTLTSYLLEDFLNDDLRNLHSRLLHESAGNWD